MSTPTDASDTPLRVPWRRQRRRLFWFAATLASHWTRDYVDSLNLGKIVEIVSSRYRMDRTISEPINPAAVHRHMERIDYLRLLKK